MFDVPRTLCASEGDVRIAYQVVGEGPLDLVFAAGGQFPVDLVWEEPACTRFLRRSERCADVGTHGHESADRLRTELERVLGADTLTIPVRA